MVLRDRGPRSISHGHLWLMRSRQALKTTALFQLHNIVLSSGRLLLLVLIVEEIACAHSFQTRPIRWDLRKRCMGTAARVLLRGQLLYQYLELLDTILLVLKKKPLAFLHVFHHSATALLCYTQRNGRPSVSWVPITLNRTVHVTMYYCYYATPGGRTIWWKKYLTSMQITQFIIDLCVGYFVIRTPAGYSYFPRIPNPGPCSGSEGNVVFGCSLLTSYLFLFISRTDTLIVRRMETPHRMFLWPLVHFH
ncbi:ELO family [Gautieria morchelliformis]|nr:ELO family [Gautieria morchelliformis]